MYIYIYIYIHIYIYIYKEQARYNLKNDWSIVIKEADLSYKGSAVVIWGKKDYLWKQKSSFLVKKFMKFQVTPLFLLKLFMILSKKFEEGTFLVIF